MLPCMTAQIVLLCVLPSDALYLGKLTRAFCRIQRLFDVLSKSAGRYSIAHLEERYAKILVADLPLLKFEMQERESRRRHLEPTAQP